MALYRDGGGTAVVAVSFGTRDADIVGLPPRAYGAGELDRVRLTTLNTGPHALPAHGRRGWSSSDRTTQGGSVSDRVPRGADVFCPNRSAS